MIFLSLTNEVQKLVEEAVLVAKELKLIEVSPEVIMYTILKKENLITNLIKKNNFDIRAMRTALEYALLEYPKAEADIDPEFSLATEELFKRSYELMAANEDKYLALDILWFGLRQSKAKDILIKVFDPEVINMDLKRLRGKDKVLTRDYSEASYLEKFSRDLTTLAKDGKINEVHGRVDEIHDIANVLLKKTKNNPILVGKAGIGKTAIIEGLAHKINAGEFEKLKDFKLFELNLTSVCSCDKTAKQKMQAIIEEVQARESEGEKIIIFIDEIHRIITGKGGLADVLKPVLARGEFKLIGATTADEYNKYFEKDAAFQRRFQKVLVEEPDEETTLFILQKIAPKLEKYHDVVIPGTSLSTAVKLSKRYIHNRTFPDKAIDLLDEACALVANSRGTENKEIKDKRNKVEFISNKIKSLQDAIDASENNEFKAYQASKIKELQEEKEELQKEIKEAEKLLKKERMIFSDIVSLKEELKEFQEESFKLKAEPNKETFKRIIQLETEIIPGLKATLEQLENSISNLVVTETEIKRVVSKWVGIPEEELAENDFSKIRKIDELLKERVQGQDQAISAVAKAIKRNKAGLGNPNRPIGSFMFLGPTGVGKTETAKALSEFLFGDDGNMIRFDMSEFQEAHTVSKFIGSPAGYVGHEEGGQLTNAVKNKPYSVILFDEIEKAHKRVFDVLLQVLDDGRLTDGKGVTVDFTNTVIIFTSNIGGLDLAKIPNDVVRKQEAMHELQKYYRPEFLNRLDDIVVFNQLDKEAVALILNNRIQKLADKLLEEKFLELIVTTAAKVKMMSQIDTDTFGARPINRIISTEIEDKITDMILDSDLKPGDKIIIDSINNRIEALKG